MQETVEDGYLCPSFNNFGYLAEIAAKISDEFQSSENDSSGDEDFEFSLVSESCDTAEFIYNDGQIKLQPIFPVFNRDLLLPADEDPKKVNDESDSSIHIPLKNLFLEEQESTTSSEADELETIPEGTYCMWKPKISEPSPGRCKKSKSTGSVSKKWRIRDLLRRSNSDGKYSFVFLTPKKRIKDNNISIVIPQMESGENRGYTVHSLILKDKDLIFDRSSAQRKANKSGQEKKKDNKRRNRKNKGGRGIERVTGYSTGKLLCSKLSG